MVLDRLRVPVVCGLLLVSCATADERTQGVASTVPPSSPAGTTTATTVTTDTSPSAELSVVDGPWAHEAQLFFDALYGEVLRDIAGFYTASAVAENRVSGHRLEGREAIARFPGNLFDSPGYTRLLFVTADRAATIREVDTEVSPVTDFAFYEMRDGRIAFESNELAITELASWGYVTKNRAERVGALYTAYLTAWDSGEGERIEAVYQPGATRTDGLFGGTWTIGEDWANSLPAHLRVNADTITYQAVVDAHLPDDTTLTTAVSGVPTNDDPNLVHATFGLSGEHGCQLRLMATWELDDYLIASEEILYDIESLRSCAWGYGLGPLPEGWWTGWELPPVFEEVTAQMTTSAGTTIDVVNGDRRQIQLLEWGLGRFERAGLAAPIVDVVAFPPTQWCAHRHGEYFGLTMFEADRTQIDLCVFETEICIGPTCDTMRSAARLGLLHELAHVWEHQHLDDATRDAFLDERGLDVWWVPNPAGTPIDTEEGAEQAADIIAWGLMDEEVPMIRIAGATREQLQADFRLLTDAESLLGT